MELNIFTVFDSKAEAFLPPFYVPMVGQATRIFQNCANDPKHQFGANPLDYALFHVGTFDDNTAKFDLKIAPENLGLAQAFKESPQLPDPDFNLVDKTQLKEAQ